jgi:Peptidase family S41
VEQITRVLNHRVNELFPDGAVVRAELLRDVDNPGQLTVRVFIPATEDPVAWAAAHQEPMAELRGELSLRLPSAKTLEFTSDAPDAPVVSMPDDGSQAAEQLPYLPGSRYLDRPVYLLTSGRTFSGGEDIAYTLQAQGRAEVIGEVTGGGAHPTRGFPISPAVHIGIPFARSINPVTGTNWQGTGVIPDTVATSDEAYNVAYAKALAHAAGLSDIPPPIADEAREKLAALTG